MISVNDPARRLDHRTPHHTDSEPKSSSTYPLAIHFSLVPGLLKAWWALLGQEAQPAEMAGTKSAHLTGPDEPSQAGPVWW